MSAAARHSAAVLAATISSSVGGGPVGSSPHSEVTQRTASSMNPWAWSAVGDVPSVNVPSSASEPGAARSLVRVGMFAPS
jgi:hypothetical protein